MVVNREDLLNSPIESGVRTLIILNAVTPHKCDLHRLVVYDYLLVHSRDIDDRLRSLHADSPFRSSELIVRRQVVENGLNLVFSKGLVKKFYESDGILYSASSLTQNFLSYFDSEYARKATQNAKWINEKFSNMCQDELVRNINGKIGRWNTEFAGDPFEELEKE